MFRIGAPSVRAAFKTALGVSLVPGLVLASGYETEYPDNGGRALGRAGAFVAKADDPTAIYYNPAGLTKQKGTNILLSANAISLTHRFAPSDDVLGRKTRQFGDLEQNTALFVAPMIAAHFDFEALPDFDFGIGIYGPASSGRRTYQNQYPIQGASRSGKSASLTPSQSLAPNGMIWDNTLVVAFPTISMAWRATEQLSVGISLQAAYFDAQINTAMGGPAPGVIKLDVTDAFTPTAVLGMMYAPVKSFEFGLSVRPPFQVSADGTATINTYEQRAQDDDSLSPLGTGGEVPLVDADGTRNNDIEFVFNHPLVVRLGARFIQPDFDIEIDYLYQRQSVQEQYDVRFKGDEARVPIEGGEPIVVTPIPEIADLRKYQDTNGIRIGGDYNVSDLLALRGGYTWEQGSSPSKYTHLDFPGLDQQSFHLGFGLKFDLVDVDLGYAYVLLADRTVTDSDVKLIDVTLPRENWKVIGNGTFSGNYHIVGLSTNWHL